MGLVPRIQSSPATDFDSDGLVDAVFEEYEGQPISLWPICGLQAASAVHQGEQTGASGSLKRQAVLPKPDLSISIMRDRSCRARRLSQSRKGVLFHGVSSQ